MILVMGILMCDGMIVVLMWVVCSCVSVLLRFGVDCCRR